MTILDFISDFISRLRMGRGTASDRKMRFVSRTLLIIGLAALPALSTSAAMAASPQQSQATALKPGAQSAFPAGTVVVGKAQMVVERPLPAFTLSTSDDQPITGQTLVEPGYWMVIYRSRKCTQCDDLMKTLSQQTANASRMVFVVSDITGANLLLLEQQYPNLAGAHWLRDPKRSFALSMKINGTPHVLGMHNGAIRWQRGGISSTDTTFPAAVDTWFKYNLLPPNKFVRTQFKPHTNQKSGSSTSTPSSSSSSTQTPATAGTQQ